MTKFNSYTEISSGHEDSVIEELDLSDETIEKIKEVIESIATKAYEKGYEDGEEEATSE